MHAAIGLGATGCSPLTATPIYIYPKCWRSTCLQKQNEFQKRANKMEKSTFFEQQTHDRRRVERTEEHILRIYFTLDNINTNFAPGYTKHILTVHRQPLISAAYLADNHKTATNCGPCNKIRHLHHQIRPH